MNWLNTCYTVGKSKVLIILRSLKRMCLIHGHEITIGRSNSSCLFQTHDVCGHTMLFRAYENFTKSPSLCDIARCSTTKRAPNSVCEVWSTELYKHKQRGYFQDMSEFISSSSKRKNLMTTSRLGLRYCSAFTQIIFIEKVNRICVLLVFNIHSSLP